MPDLPKLSLMLAIYGRYRQTENPDEALGGQPVPAQVGLIELRGRDPSEPPVVKNSDEIFPVQGVESDIGLRPLVRRRTDVQMPIFR